MAEEKYRKIKHKAGGTSFVGGPTDYQSVQRKGQDAPGNSGDSDGAIPDEEEGKLYLPEGARNVRRAPENTPLTRAQEAVHDPETEDDEDEE